MDAVVAGVVEAAPRPVSGPVADGTECVLVAKVDLQGKLVWQRCVDAGPAQTVRVVVDREGDIILVASFSPIQTERRSPASLVQERPEGALSLTKLNADGRVHWRVPVSPHSGRMAAPVITVDDSDNVIVAFADADDARHGTGMIVSCFGADGNLRWSSRVGDGARVSPVAIASGPSGDVTIMAGCGPGADLGGGPLPGEGVVCLASFAKGGRHLWSERVGRRGRIGGTGFVRAPSGGAFMASAPPAAEREAAPRVEHEAVVAKLGPDGGEIWQHSFSWRGWPRLALVRDVVVLGGDFFDAVDLGQGTHIGAGGSDLLIAGFSASSGRPLWSTFIGGRADESMLAFAGLDPSHVVALVGCDAPTGEHETVLVKLTAGPAAPSGPICPRFRE